MRLKYLELENFKMFVGRIRIPFVGNFIGITGPNGSGKSNIMDAVLFILGPKSSKSMRAENLSQLIFNGGKNGKPAKHCRVTLAFDDDGREVALSRSVRVKGKNHYSHYYMNGKSSSLTEFGEFFGSMGMGGHFNVVQQGDVNKIITAGPHERRKILENVAGVSNFDDDIEGAKRKKEAVEEDLRILEARLEEVRESMKSLEADRKKALRFKELRENLQRDRTRLVTKQILGYASRIEENLSHIKSCDDQMVKIRDDLEKIDLELDEKKREKSHLENEIKKILGEEGAAVQGEISECSVKIKTFSELINFHNNQIRQDKESVRGANKRGETLGAELKSAEKTKNALDENLKNVDRNIDEKKRKIEEIRGSVRDADNKAEEIQRGLSTLKSERERAFNQKHEKTLRLEKLRAESGRKREDIRLFEEDLRNLEERAKDAKKRSIEREERMKELSRDVIEKKRETSKLGNRKEELRSELKRIRTELERLNRDYVRALGNTNRAVSAVLSARNLGKLRGITGTLGEKIKPKKEEYTLALQVTAGQRMNAIITETDEAAAQAIDMLKKDGIGRAEFLPLNRLVAPKPAGKALLVARDRSALGFASALLDFDESIKTAVDYVFGRTVVIDRMHNARKLMGGVRLVTLEGEIIESSGAMIGGSMRVNRTVVLPEALKQEIEEKNGMHEKLSSELSDTEERIINQEMGVKKALEEKKMLESSMEYFNEGNLPDMKKRALGAGNELRGLENEIKTLEGEIKRLDEELNSLGDRIKRATEDLERITPKDKRIRMEKLEGDIADHRGLKDQISSKIIEASESVADRRGALEQEEKEVVRLKREIETSRKEVEMAERNKETEKEKLRILIKIKEGYDTKSGSLGRDRDIVDEEIKNLEIGRSKKESRLDTDGDLRENYSRGVEELKKMLAEKEEELASTGMECSEEEVISLSTEELGRSIKQTEKRIDDMGDVNQRAVEQYDEILSREGDMAAEMDRLDSQKTSLIALMDECIEKKTEVFLQVFEAVNENFKNIYSDMSDGGRGELRLENEKNPFEGGLKILAEPPGKKTLSIGPLSGGEKSVAALTLIFAIQKISPSPFYFLDEVDMFLDSINAEVLGEMIRGGSNETQTLIISLKKATLKHASAVYGITAVDGVSHMIGKININVEVEDEV